MRDAAGGGPTREQLQRQLREKETQVAALEKRLANATEFPEQEQQRFAATATAMGLSYGHRALWFSQPGARRKTVVVLTSGPLEEARKLSANFLAAGVNLLAFEPTGVDSAALPKAQRPHLLRQADLAVAALYAAVVEEKVAGVLLQDAPDHHGSETALFRILRYADIPQSAALLFPRPIYFLGEKAKCFRWTEEVYRLLGQAGRCDASTESPAAIVTKQ